MLLWPMQTVVVRPVPQLNPEDVHRKKMRQHPPSRVRTFCFESVCASLSLVLSNRVAVDVAHGPYPSVILPSTTLDVQLVEARKTTSKKNVDVANAQVEVSSAAVGVLDECPRHGALTCDSASPSLTTNRSSMCVFVLTLKLRFRWITFFLAFRL
jgi:hypothetical protein